MGTPGARVDRYAVLDEASVLYSDFYDNGTSSAYGLTFTSRELFQLLDARYQEADRALAQTEALAASIGVGAESILRRELAKARAELGDRTS